MKIAFLENILSLVCLCVKDIYAELAGETIKQLPSFCTIYLCKKILFSIVHKETSVEIETDLCIHISNIEKDFANLLAKKQHPYHSKFLFGF